VLINVNGILRIYFQVGVLRVNFAKSSIIHAPSGLKIKVKFLEKGDGWTIDQNYSTRSAKIRNSHGFSQQLFGLFSAEGVHLPKKVGSGKTKPVSVPDASRAGPAAHANARSHSENQYDRDLECSSAAENEDENCPSYRRERQRDSSGKQELVRCNDGHFRLLPKKNQKSNAEAATGSKERPTLECITPVQKKSRNARDADSPGTGSSNREASLKQSTTKQTPPRRRLFQADSAQSDEEVPSKQEAEKKRLKTDCAKSRHNINASMQRAQSALPDNAAFAGAHPKSKPRHPTVPVDDNDYYPSDDEQDQEYRDEG
jgi:hypothetical protein